MNFSDMLTGDTLRRLVEANMEANGGEYVPGARTLFNIPKAGFTLRYALETGVTDRALYQGLASFLIPYYDKLIPWNSFSHRFDYESRRSSERYTFKNGIESWKHFVGSTRSALSPSSYLVSTDVANFFEHIQLQRLRQTMEELSPIVSDSPELQTRLRAHREVLFNFLDKWAYEPGRGLPQNRDASSFLANLYMREIDLSMIDAGYKDTYFRYMDDIKVVCEDLYQARRAIKDLSVRLRELGLSLNARKTEIVAASDITAVDACLDEGSEAIQQIDQLWRRKSRGPSSRFGPYCEIECSN
ncbi:RNA-directed DNA polymerase [Ramlibacter montanisoli]|uniref:RNA-directed DNA polymerase n=1 Tax=Ramlibacter montanisoli TaxID=2732512 RepID=A0A849K4L8_9BURK|nr:RNA-directed DNA polymerase [Ramlibacter montanisoli]NNU43368.1 RNA-directed DNA polymerase [Ramlibacter montanisoli]